MSIENIQFLVKKLDEEHTSHLKMKAELSQEVKELAQMELNLRKTLNDLQTAISKVSMRQVNSTDSDDITQLVTTVQDLENEVIQNRHNSTAVETELTHEKIQLGMIKNKIDVLKSEKEELETINRQKKQEQLLQKNESRKVQSKRERLDKLRRKIEKQEEVKENLSNFIFVSNLIDQVVSGDSTEDQEEDGQLEGVTTDVREMIIEARDKFIQARSKFSSNNLTPFLKDADLAYTLGIKSWILLSDSISDKIVDDSFSDQTFEIVNKGLTLNTRHLAAVDSMLKKIQKEVEIAPLASFANEVQEYFIENLSLLRIFAPIDE